MLQHEIDAQGLGERQDKFPDDTHAIPSDRDAVNRYDEVLPVDDEENYIDYGAPGTEEEEDANIQIPNDASSDGTDALDYDTDFDLKAQNLLDAFNNLVDISTKSAQAYMVNIPKKTYDSIYKILSNLDNGREYIDAFLRGTQNSERNADLRTVDGTADKTVERARELSGSDYDVLVNTFGMVPVAQTDDEIGILIKKRNLVDEKLEGEEVVQLRQKSIQAQNDLKILMDSAAAKRVEYGKEEDRERKKELYRQLQSYASRTQQARVEMFAAKEKYERTRTSELGFAGSKYAVLKKSDVAKYLDDIAFRRANGENIARGQNAALIDDYKSGKLTINDLRERLIADTDFSGMSEATVELVKKNIAGMSAHEIIHELVESMAERNVHGLTDGILKAIPNTSFDKYGEFKEYISNNGGWMSEGGAFANLGVEKSYYAHAGLLKLIHTYRNMCMRTTRLCSTVGRCTRLLRTGRGWIRTF